MPPEAATSVAKPQTGMFVASARSRIAATSASVAAGLPPGLETLRATASGLSKNALSSQGLARSSLRSLRGPRAGGASIPRRLTTETSFESLRKPVARALASHDISY